MNEVLYQINLLTFVELISRMLVVEQTSFDIIIFRNTLSLNKLFVFDSTIGLRRNDSQVSEDFGILDSIFEEVKTNLNDSLEKKMPMTFDL